MAKIIVAGGLGILGDAVVRTLAGEGHRIAVVDIGEAQLEGTADHALFGGIDLADPAAVDRAYADAVAALGGLDGVVNVAGGFAWEQVATGAIETWDRMYRMNLRTAAVSSRAAAAHLGRGGAIVNVGAAAAASPGIGMAPYAASKAGVAALTESLAEELRDRGIRVNAVLPTIIDTPANRADMPDADTSGWVRPEAAAQVVAFLLSPAAASVTGVGVRLSLAG